MNQLASIGSQARPAAKYQESILIFSGQTSDFENCIQPRFSRAFEPLAKARIREAVMQEFRRGWVASGIASAFGGGDILFHEVCAELGVRTELYLAFPPDEFIEKCLVPAGEEWVERFVRLADTTEIRVLPAAQRMVEVVANRSTDELVWKRCNQWMLKTALSNGPQVTLIALSGGEPDETAAGSGGMVEEAAARGAKTVILDTREIFGLH